MPPFDPEAQFRLHRIAVLPEGAFGVLLQNGIPFAVTLEPTFGGAHGQAVKIPAGRGLCTRTWFHRGNYETFEIHVPGHARLLFHRGNVEADSEGCVLVAESYAQFRGAPGIADSRGGFAEFMSRAATLNQFELEVVD